MSRYERLKHVLKNSPTTEWRVSFRQLEEAIGVTLPASAYKYPAWWSNNSSNSVMTKVWLEAGWRTRDVDVPGQKVTFYRVERPESGRGAYGNPGSDPDDGPGGLNDTGFDWEPGLEPAGAPEREKSLSEFYGCMKGTIRLNAQGAVPSVKEPEEWREMEEEMENEWDALYGPFVDALN